MITLIAPIYSNTIHKHFLNSILEQKSETFDLIILTNNFSQDFLNKFDEIEKSSNCKLQIVFTTRKIGFNQVIIEGANRSTGTHAIILNSSEPIPKNFVSNLSAIVDKKPDVDIFEFKASFKGFENWMPRKRCDLKPNHIFNIIDFPRVIAFTFPFISNKLFKISLANSVSKKTNYIETSSHLSLEFLYMLFLYAETYVYIDKVFCNIVIWKEDLPNYSNFYKELKNIRIKYVLENKFIQEIEYVSVFYGEVFIPLLYSHKKLISTLLRSDVNKTITKKIYDKNKKLRLQEFSAFNYTNIYMMLNLLETEYLNKSYPPNEWSRIIKILR